MISLANKQILVTGASAGIGKQIAITAAEVGATVTLVGRNTERLNEVLGLLKGDGHTAISVDLTDFAKLSKLIKTGPIYDGVVFNAGIAEYAPIKFITADKINNLFNINFNGSVLLCQQLVRNKLLNRNSSLVFISSISSKIGVPGTAIYASSKAAISAFSKVTASELAPQGIRSNSICPGIVITAMTDKASEVTSSEDLQKGAEQYPLGYGEPTDVANLAMFLLSDLSKWMTGVDILIDGGLTIK